MFISFGLFIGHFQYQYSARFLAIRRWAMGGMDALSFA
jgi:hypothetical protein